MKIENEFGVIVAFAEYCLSDVFPWKLVSIDGFFPDAIIEHKTSGETYTVEFEYMASSFISHRHNLTKCDILICNGNDWPTCPITVWALDDVGCNFQLRAISEWSIEQHQKRLEFDQLQKRITKLELLIETGHIVIDLQTLALTRNERRLMVLMLQNEGNTCDREEIALAVWKREYTPKDDFRIEQLLSRLRSKLGDTCPSATIQTVRGRGYILVLDS